MWTCQESVGRGMCMFAYWWIFLFTTDATLPSWGIQVVIGFVFDFEYPMSHIFLYEMNPGLLPERSLISYTTKWFIISLLPKHTKHNLTKLPKLASGCESVGLLILTGTFKMLSLSLRLSTRHMAKTICCALWLECFSIFPQRVTLSLWSPTVPWGRTPLHLGSEAVGCENHLRKTTEMLHFRAGWSLYELYLTYLTYILLKKQQMNKKRNACLRKSEFNKTFAESQNLTCPTIVDKCLFYFL